MEVHGISDQFLEDKPLFETVAREFLEFVDGADLIIHNAPFDVGFINHEIAKLKGAYQVIESGCRIIDTLALARQKHPGQKNNLDALCKRYGVDNSQRDLHGALLDAEILADVYLLMTGGQVNLNISGQQSADGGQDSSRGGIRRLTQDRQPLRVVTASQEEVELHQQKLDAIHKSSGNCVWMNGGD
jgi:DNA polymerase-3 subunit epsilon